jgi:hypothetical protein
MTASIRIHRQARLCICAVHGKKFGAVNNIPGHISSSLKMASKKAVEFQILHAALLPGISPTRPWRVESESCTYNQTKEKILRFPVGHQVMADILSLFSEIVPAAAHSIRIPGIGTCAPAAEL